MNSSLRRGFTLIELLVVIAIIGLLATVVLASLNTARSKSRDARRLSDLKQMANLVAALGESQTFIGCTAAGLATGCTTPNFQAFSDPSSTTLCVAAPSGQCAYRVGKQSAAGQPTSADWNVCTFLENSNPSIVNSTGVAMSAAGPVHIGSDTNYAIMTGGCAN